MQCSGAVKVNGVMRVSLLRTVIGEVRWRFLRCDDVEVYFDSNQIFSCLKNCSFSICLFLIDISFQIWMHDSYSENSCKIRKAFKVFCVLHWKQKVDSVMCRKGCMVVKNCFLGQQWVTLNPHLLHPFCGQMSSLMRNKSVFPIRAILANSALVRSKLRMYFLMSADVRLIKGGVITIWTFIWFFKVSFLVHSQTFSPRCGEWTCWTLK